MATWASEFFPGMVKKIFPEGDQSGEISFYPLEIKKQPFSLKL